MSIPKVLAMAWLCGYAIAMVGYASAWENEWTLWTVATLHAPIKPRPVINLAVAAIERREFIVADRLLTHVALILRTRQNLPPWDRTDATIALQRNRLLLARLTDSGRRRW